MEFYHIRIVQVDLQLFYSMKEQSSWESTPLLSTPSATLHLSQLGISIDVVHCDLKQ